MMADLIVKFFTRSISRSTFSSSQTVWIVERRKIRESEIFLLSATANESRNSKSSD